jgi:hypothetical protein
MWVRSTDVGSANNQLAAWKIGRSEAAADATALHVGEAKRAGRGWAPAGERPIILHCALRPTIPLAFHFAPALPCSPLPVSCPLQQVCAAKVDPPFINRAAAAPAARRIDCTEGLAAGQHEAVVVPRIVQYTLRAQQKPRAEGNAQGRQLEPRLERHPDGALSCRGAGARSRETACLGCGCAHWGQGGSILPSPNAPMTTVGNPTPIRC